MATSNWTSLGTPGNISANPSIGKNDDGRLEAFVWTVGVDAAQDLWHIWQTTTGGSWGTWSSLGHPPTGLILEGSPIVVQNDDGRLEVFATGPDNALWHIWQVAPNGSWSTWNSLGKPAGTSYIMNPIASQNQDGRLEAFVFGSDNALWHIWQTTAGGSWGTWFSSGGLASSNPAIYRPFVRKNDDGRLEIFVTIETVDEPFGTNPTAALWHIWQVAPNGTWSNWASLGTPTTGGLSGPSVRKNDDGRLEVFTIASDGALWHIWQTTTGGVWGTWSSLGTPSGSVNAFGDPFVAENDDGRLEAFAVGSDGALWHTWQVSAGGHWGS